MTKFICALITICIASSLTQAEERKCDNLPEAGSFRNNENVICEDSRGVLRCPKNRFIRITYADFGRIDNTQCRVDSLPVDSNEMNPSVPCMSDVERKMRRKCQDKQTCIFHVNSNIFGDPCPGTSKFLTVKYDCLPRRRILCDTQSADLTCPPGKVIHVTYASYGRRNSKTCHSEFGSLTAPELNPAEPCHESVKAVVGNRCDGQRECAVQASASMLASDPCGSNINKYLRVAYRCKNDPSFDFEASKRMSVVCDHQNTTLTCDSGNVVRIIQAVFGRQDRETCAAGSTRKQLRRQDCHICVAKKVREWCNEEESCFVPSTTEEFGDPCKATSKYLNLLYACVPY